MTTPAVAQEKNYWRSLDELAATPEFTEFLHREFPVAASEFPQGMSRRRWLQLMGAALGMAGLAGCRWQKETLAPFVVRPENRVPGVPQRFASSLEYGGAARPVVATAYDGRPIKLEGNLEHPASRGGTDTFTQASLLHLYDPDRSQDVLEFEPSRRFTRTWDDFAEFSQTLTDAAQSDGGAKIRLLTEPNSSPTRLRLANAFLKKLPNAKWYDHAAYSRQNQRIGAKLAFGDDLRPVYELSGANVILALDSDLFDFHPDSVRLIRAWSDRRVPEAGAMNRVYAVESQFSTIGSVADHRLPVRSSDIGQFLAQLESAVTSEINGSPKADETSSTAEPAARWLKALVSDLVANRGHGLVVVGPTQPAEVHAASYRLNKLLGNVGETISFVREPQSSAVASADGLAELTAEINRGDVETLFIIGGNPAYESTAFAQALPKVKNRIRMAGYVDETSLLSSWHLPQSHAMETWGDGYSYSGTLTLRQPLIDPIYATKSEDELLALLAGVSQTGPESLVRTTLSESMKSASLDDSWRRLVHDGFLAGTSLAVVNPEVVANGRTEGETPAGAAQGLEVVFTLSPSTYDGRYANNGWLQETPAALTKLTWQNAAILSPATASRHGVVTGDLVTVSANDASIELPVYVLPGQAADSVGLALGYGRTAAGHVGGSQVDNVAAVGVNAYPLRSTAATSFVREVKLAPTGRKMTLAVTQDHHAIDKVGLAELAGRIGQLVREGTEQQFKSHPDFAQHMTHHPPLESLWKERSPEGHAWGMAIDLSRCVGCNACMVACQSENNVPIVGPEQVSKGREMHWIRVDRYFAGDVENPQVVTQPVTCHHCENAPCEQVCPVAATVHSPEGLNDMAYNRCVGTRYCANNCPYKVRRFNFLDFTSHLSQANEELARLIINPEVTVRSRGVMEKCTYCVQRIQNVKIQSKNEQHSIPDGAIQTACQQACPAGAIVFGDLLNKSSVVASAHANPRSYAMLDELNIKPRTRYLARIRNPHPDLAPADSHHDEEHAHS